MELSGRQRPCFAPRLPAKHGQGRASGERSCDIYRPPATDPLSPWPRCLPPIPAPRPCPCPCPQLCLSLSLSHPLSHPLPQLGWHDD